MTRRRDDFVQPFQIEAPEIRGRLVRLGPSLDAILRGHGYPQPVASMLAEILVLTCVLGSGLKFDGIFTLQIHGDGPIGLVVADLTSAGDLRGYVRYDHDRLVTAGPRPEGPVPHLIGAGRMAFTVDQGPHAERYQGITALEGATVADCAHAHLRQSEQLDTAIILRAAVSEASASGGEQRAAALMLQRLPPRSPALMDAEEDWRRSVALMSSVTPEELLDPSVAAAEVLYRLFHEDGVRMFKTRPLRHRCRCSRARVERTLRAFPSAEVGSFVEDDGAVRVRCEFCAAEYIFDEADLERLSFPQ